MGSSFAEVQARKTKPRKSVTIVLDPVWAQELGELQVKVELLQKNARPSDTDLADEIDDLMVRVRELEAQADEKVQTFVFTSISPDRYERLVAAHPPTKAQRTELAKVGQRVAYNPDTFPPALVHACLVSPEWTAEEVRSLWAKVDESDTQSEQEAREERDSALWSAGELAELFAGAQAANWDRPRVG